MIVGALRPWLHYYVAGTPHGLPGSEQGEREREREVLGLILDHIDRHGPPISSIVGFYWPVFRSVKCRLSNLH